MKKLHELEAVIRKIIFSSNDGTFVILAASTVNNELTIKGNVRPGGIQEGLSYRFHGYYVDDPKYGRQFTFKNYVQTPGRTRHSVAEYINRTCKSCGIGPVTAMKIVDKFGPDHAIETLRTSPRKCIDITPTLTEDNVLKAASALANQFKFEATKIELISLMSGYGFTSSTIDAAIKKWGIHAAERIRRDPFSLLVSRLPGAGFHRVSQLYSALGLPMNRLKVQMICIWDVIMRENNGSTWMLLSTVERAVEERYSGRMNHKAVILGVRAGWLALYRDESQEDRPMYITIREHDLHEKELANSIAMFLEMEVLTHEEVKV